MLWNIRLECFATGIASELLNFNNLCFQWWGCSYSDKSFRFFGVQLSFLAQRAQVTMFQVLALNLLYRCTGIIFWF